MIDEMTPGLPADERPLRSLARWVAWVAVAALVAVEVPVHPCPHHFGPGTLQHRGAAAAPAAAARHGAPSGEHDATSQPCTCLGGFCQLQGATQAPAVALQAPVAVSHERVAPQAPSLLRSFARHLWPEIHAPPART